MASSKKKVIIFILVIVLLLLVILPVVFYFLANTNAKSKVADFAESIKDICLVDYGSVTYNIINRHLIINDISVTCSNEKIMDIKKAEFNHIVSSSPVPSNVQADFTDGILYNKSKLFKDYGKTIADLGFDKIDFNGRISYTLGKASKEFKFVSIDIKSKDIGQIKGNMKVLNAYDNSLKNILNNIANNPASFYITFTDNGLKNKVFEKFAAISELEVDAVKAKVNNAVYKRAINTDNFTKSNYTQLEKFLLSSNSVSIELNEQDNLSLKNTLNSLDISGYRKLLNSIKNVKVEIMAK